MKNQAKSPAACLRSRDDWLKTCFHRAVADVYEKKRSWHTQLLPNLPWINGRTVTHFAHSFQSHFYAYKHCVIRTKSNNFWMKKWINKLYLMFHTALADMSMDILVEEARMSVPPLALYRMDLQAAWHCSINLCLKSSVCPQCSMLTGISLSFSSHSCSGTHKNKHMLACSSICVSITLVHAHTHAHTCTHTHPPTDLPRSLIFYQKPGEHKSTCQPSLYQTKHSAAVTQRAVSICPLQWDLLVAFISDLHSTSVSKVTGVRAMTLWMFTVMQLSSLAQIPTLNPFPLSLSLLSCPPLILVKHDSILHVDIYM